MNVEDIWVFVNRQYVAHLVAAQRTGDRACAGYLPRRCPRGQQLWEDVLELYERKTGRRHETASRG